MSDSDESGELEVFSVGDLAQRPDSVVSLSVARAHDGHERSSVAVDPLVPQMETYMASKQLVSRLKIMKKAPLSKLTQQQKQLLNNIRSSVGLMWETRLGILVLLLLVVSSTRNAHFYFCFFLTFLDFVDTIVQYAHFSNALLGSWALWGAPGGLGPRRPKL